MINGMMTLSGAWHKLRSDPILRFLVVSHNRERLFALRGHVEGWAAPQALSAVTPGFTADNRERKKSFDEATMLPFADDPEAKKHVEQASRSNKE